MIAVVPKPPTKDKFPSSPLPGEPAPHREQVETRPLLFAICHITSCKGNAAITRLLLEAKQEHAAAEVALAAAERDVAEMEAEALHDSQLPWLADELHELEGLRDARHKAEARLKVAAAE